MSRRSALVLVGVYPIPGLGASRPSTGYSTGHRLVRACFISCRNKTRRNAEHYMIRVPLPLDAFPVLACLAFGLLMKVNNYPPAALRLCHA
jgi:hypothetical protein